MSRLLTIASWLFIACSKYDPAPPAASSSVTDELDRRLPALLDAHRVAAVGVALIDDGRITWTKVYGQQGPGTPATDQTLFNVASLAKTVTAETILRLVSAGEISLDEPLAAHWVDPDVAGDPRHRRLTPGLVLTHRTGFLNWRRLNQGGRLAFVADPGTRFGYSGEGFVYLARFAERKLGKGLEALAQAQVFDPIGLRGISYSARGWTSGRVATPMDEYGEFGTAELADSGRGDPADDLFVTVGDYATFMISVMKGEGVSQELATERLRLQSDATADPQYACPPGAVPGACPDSIGYGLGWMRIAGSRGTVMYHGGNDWGEHAAAYFYPDTHDGLVLLTNGGNGMFVMLDAVELIDNRQPLTSFVRAALAGAATVRVITATTGDVAAARGLSFRIDGYRRIRIGAADTVVVRRQAPGAHTIELGGVPAGCTIVGGPSQKATAGPGGTADFKFQVSC